MNIIYMVENFDYIIEILEPVIDILDDSQYDSDSLKWIVNHCKKYFGEKLFGINFMSTNYIFAKLKLVKYLSILLFDILLSGELA